MQLMQSFIPNKTLSRFSGWLARNQHVVIFVSFVTGVFLLGASYLPEAGIQTDSVPISQRIFDIDHWRHWLAQHWREVARDIAHLLIPASAAIAAILVYLRHAGAHFDGIQVRFFKSHTIICGLSTRACLLADDLVKQGNEVVIISLDHEHEDVTEQRIKGVAVLHGDACNSNMLEKAGFHRAAQLVCMTNSDETNITILDSARALAARQKERKGREPDITCYCHIRNAALRAQLDRVPLMESKREGARFRIFNTDEITAAELLRRFPPERQLAREQHAGGTHVVLIGGNNLFFALALQMAQQCHYWRPNPGEGSLPRTRLSLVSPDGENLLEKLKEQCPAIEQLLDIKVVPLVPESASAFDDLSPIAGIPVSQYFIAMSDEISTLAVANTLTRALQKAGQNAGDRVIAVTPARLKQIDPNAWSEAAGISVVPAYESLKGDTVFGMSRDQKAMKVHERYLQTTISLGKRLGESPALFEWDGLCELLRDSNRQQVAHMDIKLRAIGWSVDAAPVASREITGDLLEQLADMEHRRWMAFHFVRGWQHAAIRNDALLQHDCLVPYADLPDQIKEYDRSTVRNMIALWPEFKQIREAS
jgi:hypothetical protein